SSGLSPSFENRDSPQPAFAKASAGGLRGQSRRSRVVQLLGRRALNPEMVVRVHPREPQDGARGRAGLQSRPGEFDSLTSCHALATSRGSISNQPMRQYVIDKPGAELRLDSAPDPVPGPGEVLVRVRACAL